MVLVEPGVLRRDDRLLHHRRDVVDRHVAAVFVVQHGEQRFVVTRVDVGDLRRWYQFELGRKAVEGVGARLRGEPGYGYGRERGGRHDEASQQAADEQRRGIGQQSVVTFAHPGHRLRGVRDASTGPASWRTPPRWHRRTTFGARFGPGAP